ncbi:MAG TPA: hypothetical protein VMP00_03095 [Burkholderiales bacterium]|nr:hypothetical protein [Burkholderiales bacterium]
MRKLTGIAVLVLLFWAQPVPAAIDCSRAILGADKLVCSSPRAAAAENYMARSFRNAIRRGVDVRYLRETQLEWKETVRDVCITVDCLMEAYLGRAADLDDL